MSGTKSDIEPMIQRFVAVVHSERGDGDDLLDDMYEAGLDDALIQTNGTRITMEFERENSTLVGAILAAFHQIEQIPGCSLVRIGQDDVVSLAEIGRRIGTTRESVRLLARGARGPGGFPEPLAAITSQEAWSWSEVSAWLYRNDRLTRQPVVEAQFLRAFNAALDVRAATRDVEDPETRASLIEIQSLLHSA